MIITLVGSIKFYDKFVEIKEILRKKGHKVLIPKKRLLPEPIPLKKKLKAMEDFNKDLELSDAILVLNYGKENHIGVNTLMEIGMAFNKKKKIFIINKIPELCIHELDAINCVSLRGNLDLI